MCRTRVFTLLCTFKLVYKVIVVVVFIKPDETKKKDYFHDEIKDTDQSEINFTSLRKRGFINTL